MSDEYDVGYGKPPKDKQFKKGRSGNPRGRPKGSRNFKTDLMEVLHSSVQLKDQAGSKRVSTQMASLLRLREKALKGDMKALDRLLQLALAYNDDTGDESTIAEVAQSDQSILDGFLEREQRRSETPATTSNDVADADESEDDDDAWLR
jgi:hypothetical protein